jgi:NAD(P)H-dependent FMN reductase
MDEKLVIAVIEGSARDKRESIKAARFVADIGRSLPGIEIIFVDPRDFSFPNDGNDTEGKDSKYGAITARADAFFIVTPEYNHSFPGSLKRMLDSEYENYWRKPVALAGVSNGGWGGTRAVENLLPSLRTMGLLPIQFTTYFPRVQDVFDENGVIHEDKKERYTKGITSEFEELIWIARCIKWGRANLPG